MLGLTSTRLVTNNGSLWHGIGRPQTVQDELAVTEEMINARITALVRSHDQRQLLYGRSFDADLDKELRELLNIEEDY